MTELEKDINNLRSGLKSVEMVSGHFLLVSLNEATHDITGSVIRLTLLYQGHGTVLLCCGLYDGNHVILL